MPSGILTTDSDENDVAAVLTIADTVGDWWNKRHSSNYGFSVRVSEAKVRECCGQATKLFSKGVFPDNPGPFKRLATLIVLGRLTPFFFFRAGFEDKDGNWKDVGEAPEGDQEIAWITRMLILCIPMTLSKLYVNIGGKDLPLKDWSGFPSPHYRLEFMGWLRWLDGYSNFKTSFLKPEEWEKFSEARLARMIMSTSLMLESCYYISQSAANGRCELLNYGYCGGVTLEDDDIRMDLFYDTTGQVKATPELTSD